MFSVTPSLNLQFGEHFVDDVLRRQMFPDLVVCVEEMLLQLLAVGL